MCQVGLKCDLQRNHALSLETNPGCVMYDITCSGLHHCGRSNAANTCVHLFHPFISPFSIPASIPVQSHGAAGFGLSCREGGEHDRLVASHYLFHVSKCLFFFFFFYT